LLHFTVWRSGIRYRDFYAFDPTTNTWEQRADLGTNKLERLATMARDAGIGRVHVASSAQAPALLDRAARVHD